MHPILLKLGPLNIYSYGLMVAIGFSIAAVLIYLRAAKMNLNPEKMLDVMILTLVAGIIGARIFYVISNPAYYVRNPLEVINLSKGGLIWYGGFLSSSAFLIWYLKRSRINFWQVTDLIAPYIALSQAIGRIGCFLNGCCYGTEASRGYPFGVVFPYDTVLRHPTEIYSAAALLVLFVILRLWQDRRRFTGEIFLGYGMLYSVKRFLMEFLRGDNPRVIFGLTLSQGISILIFLLSVVMFMYKASEWKKKHLISE